MGSSFSFEEVAATSKIRVYDVGRRVSFMEYLAHLSGGAVSQDTLTLFPTDLFDPKYLLLRRLVLSYHAVPSIPGEAPYYMPHLAHLDCAYNRLQSLPGNFGHFLHLKVMILSNNKLTALPASMAEMAELERADLSHNQFADFPEVLLKVTSLQQLDVSFNMLSAMPAGLLELPSLTTVVCHMNRSKSPPQEICNKGTQAILAFFREALPSPASTTSSAASAGGASATAGSSTPRSSVSSASSPTPRGRLFVRKACPEVPSLVKRLQPAGGPTLGQRQKTPLRVPEGATTLSNAQMIDSIAGLVYGAALGDALGLATEFMLREQSQFHYGMAGERLSVKNIVHDRHRCKWAKGDWTDDTDQLILILSSLVHWGGIVDEVDFAKRLTSWVEHGFLELGDTMGQGVGNTIGKAISRPEFLSTPHSVAESIWAGTDNAANGAVMRTAILGVPHFADLDTVGNDAVRICKTTHYDPRCQASCVAVCSAVALVLQGRHDLSDPSQVELLLAEATRRGSEVLTDEKHLADYKRYTAAHDFAGLDLGKMAGIGYTLKPLGSAWAALRQDGDFKSIITALVMEGGDADSNAVVAGALLGCKLGYSQLPRDWLDSLIEKNVDWLNVKINALLDLMAIS